MNRSLRRVAVGIVVQTAFLGGLAVVLPGFFGRNITGWATVGLAAVVVVAGHVQRGLRERAEMQPAAWTDELFDRPFARIGALRQQLEWGLDSAERWRRSLQPELASIAEDRLGRHHGVDWRRSPDRARQLLGEDLWRVIAEPSDTVPTWRDLGRLIERIEQL